MSRHGKCDYPACTGHLGKFPDCLTEALYSSPDWEDDFTGSTEWSVYAQLFLFDESGQTPASTTGMDHDVYIPAGTYSIVTSDDHGFVDRTDYPSKTLAQNAFNEIDRAYSAWLDTEEE